MKETKLHLGTGLKTLEGWINIDKVAHPKVDLVLNIGTEKFPFEDNSVDAVLATHFIEHLDTEESIQMLEELYRICKPGAIMEFSAPHFLSPTSCRPFHKQYISETYFVDYSVMDKSKCFSLDHKFYFNIKTKIDYQPYNDLQCLMPDMVTFWLEIVK